jgi:hypothetical protein
MFIFLFGGKDDITTELYVESLTRTTICNNVILSYTNISGGKKRAISSYEGRSLLPYSLISIRCTISTYVYL